VTSIAIETARLQPGRHALAAGGDASSSQWGTQAMRMKTASFGVISLLGAISAASAQTTIDVGKISCEQFVQMRVADPDYIAIWLSGYYHGKRNSTTIDVQELKANAQKLLHYCLYNKGTLMEAVEKLLSPTN
jgi:acid stress chaperone HdeB